MANKRICICCGNEYDYCPHCGDSKNLPRWMTNYDDEGCHIAFQTVTDYLAGEVTKEAAKVILSDVNLKHRDHFITSVAKYVDEILDGKVAENKIDLEKVDDTKIDIKADDKEHEAAHEAPKAAVANDEPVSKKEDKFHKSFEFKNKKN